MKATTKKIVTASMIVGAIVLTAWGLYEIFHVKSTGTEQHLESLAELDSIILSDTTLTDDEFMYGITHGIPQTELSEKEILNISLSLTENLRDCCEESPTVDFVNCFGYPAVRIAATEGVDLNVIIEVTRSCYNFKVIYIELHPKLSDVVTDAYKFEQGQLSRLYYDDSSTNKSKEDIQDLIYVLVEEYGVDDTKIQYTGSALICDIDALTETDALNLFDYAYQWLRLNKKEIHFTLTKDTTLLASAYIDLADERYEKYYPAPEIAPLFRMTYYKTMNFIYNGLRRACDVYL